MRCVLAIVAACVLSGTAQAQRMDLPKTQDDVKAAYDAAVAAQKKMTDAIDPALFAHLAATGYKLQAHEKYDGWSNPPAALTDAVGAGDAKHLLSGNSYDDAQEIRAAGDAAFKAGQDAGANLPLAYSKFTEAADRYTEAWSLFTDAKDWAEAATGFYQYALWLMDE